MTSQALILYSGVDLVHLALSGNALPLGAPPNAGQTMAATAPPIQSRGRNLFDLPRGVRGEIYRLALFDDAPELDIDRETDAWLPNQIGLLCASRRVYDEAAAVMYGTAYLGSNASSALTCLEFMGTRRIRQIRELVFFYQCFEVCRAEHGPPILDWMPVFALLEKSLASVRRVEVWSQFCDLKCHKFSNFEQTQQQDYLATKCLLLRGERYDNFFRGLKTLAMADHIEFMGWTPEYFVHRLERDLLWTAQGERSGDYRTMWVYTEFKGKLVNPTYPHRFGWLQYVQGLRGEGIDVSGLKYDPEDDSWKPAGIPVAPSPTPPRRNLILDVLPLEIRKTIWDLACDTWEERLYWPTKPSRWNAGIGLLSTCKQILQEALPSVYRTFKIYGSYADKTLAHLGPRVDLIQNLELHVTCFCPCTHDLYYPGTIYSREQGGFYAGNRQSDLRFAEALHRPASSSESSESPIITRHKTILTTTLHLLSTKPALRSLHITLASCARFKPRTYHTSRARRANDLSQPLCRNLEDHFLSLLLRQTPQIERLTLDGDIPPSFALRVQRRAAEEDCVPGTKLRVAYVGEGVAEFMRRTLEDRREFDSVVHLASEQVVWEKPRHYPHEEYPSTEPVTQFVLVAGQTAGGKLEGWLGLLEGVGEEGERRLAAVEREVEGKTWEEVSELLDYDNDASERVVRTWGEVDEFAEEWVEDLGVDMEI